MEELCDLFNLAFHQHVLTSPNYPLRQDFDYTREQQMGVCNSWNQKSKIYEEVNTTKRGQKPVKPDLALWPELLDKPRRWQKAPSSFSSIKLSSMP